MKKWCTKSDGFTLVELTVSVVISALLLWGVFYFLTDTLTSITRSTANTQFLSEIYELRNIFWEGTMSVLHDYSTWSGSDILLVTTWDSWVLFWAVNSQSRTLVSSWQTVYYDENLLGYRDVSAGELIDIAGDASIVFGYWFFPDKIIPNTYVREIQVDTYNSWAIHDVGFTFFPNFIPDLSGKLWSTLPEDELFNYNIIY